MNWKNLLTNVFQPKAAPVPESPEPSVLSDTLPEKIKSKFRPNGQSVHHPIHTEEEKTFIASCLGRMMSPMEILVAFKEEFGKGINNYTSIIRSIKIGEKWQPLIDSVRKEYLSSIHKVAGSHKRVRLDRNDNIYRKALDEGDFKAALTANKMSMEEMASQKGPDVNVTFNQYQLLSDDEIKEKMAEVISRINKSKKTLEITNEGRSEHNGNEG